jgi:selenide,water dikinase
MIASTTLLNKIGAELAEDKDVHAITDVTGFGILGHGLEMARGSGLTLNIKASDVPLLKEAEKLAQEGHVTGASHRNWASYGESVELPDGIPDWRRHLLTDPQTSGGLLVACAPGRAGDLVEKIKAAGYASARVFGTAEAGEAKVRVV